MVVERRVRAPLAVYIRRINPCRTPYAYRGGPCIKKFRPLIFPIPLPCEWIIWWSTFLGILKYKPFAYECRKVQELQYTFASIQRGFDEFCPRPFWDGMKEY